jgi:cyclophilin family peptidyl-prolyl cis-trans isomerase
MRGQLVPLKSWIIATVVALPVAVAGQEKVADKVALVEINTTAGRMLVELYNETPIHRDNFLKLVREVYYDSTLFHKAIPGFMIQGGDPESRKAGPNTVLGNEGPGYTLAAEIKPGLIHRKGALAAVRQPDQDNPEKRSNGSQFYLVQGRKWFPDDLTKLEKQMNTAKPDSLQVHYSPEDVNVLRDPRRNAAFGWQLHRFWAGGRRSWKCWTALPLCPVMDTTGRSPTCGSGCA